MTYWEFKRERKVRSGEESRPPNPDDPERGTTAQTNDSIRELEGLNNAERHRRELVALPFSKVYSRFAQPLLSQGIDEFRY